MDDYLKRFGVADPAVRKLALELLSPAPDPCSQEHVRQVVLLAAHVWESDETSSDHHEAGIQQRIDDFMLKLVDMETAGRSPVLEQLMERLQALTDRVDAIAERARRSRVVDSLWMSKLFLESSTSPPMSPARVEEALDEWARLEPTWWPSLFDDLPASLDLLPTEEVLWDFVDNESRGDPDVRAFLVALRGEQVNLRHPTPIGYVQVDQLLFLWLRFRGLTDGRATLAAPETRTLVDHLKAAGFVNMRREPTPPTENHLDQQMHRVRQTARRLLQEARSEDRLLDIDPDRVFCAVADYRPGNLIVRAENELHA